MLGTQTWGRRMVGADETTEPTIFATSFEIRAKSNPDSGTRSLAKCNACKLTRKLVVVVVKWSVCLFSITMIRVRIPLKPTEFFSAKIVFEKNKNIQKRPGLAHF